MDDNLVTYLFNGEWLETVYNSAMEFTTDSTVTVEYNCVTGVSIYETPLQSVPDKGARGAGYILIATGIFLFLLMVAYARSINFSPINMLRNYRSMSRRWLAAKERYRAYLHSQE